MYTKQDPAEQERITILQKEKTRLEQKHEVVTKELRALVYKQDKR